MDAFIFIKCPLLSLDTFLFLCLKVYFVWYLYSLSSSAVVIVQFRYLVMSDSLKPMDYSTAGFSVHHQLLELTQTHVLWVSDAIQTSHPPSSPPPALNLSQHQVFSSESALCIRWPKYWSFSFSISPSNYSGWFHLGLTGWISLQSKGLSRVFSNTTVQKHLWCSAFFMVQLSHPYTTVGKTIALTIWTFVSKVIQLYVYL